MYTNAAEISLKGRFHLCAGDVIEGLPTAT
jgi:hypothetical protein